MVRPYPIIEYAHKIGKNTAEFTTKDLTEYMKWWLKQPQREDLIKMTPEQKKVYDADIAKMKKLREEGARVNGETEVVEEVVDKIVCSMELTRQDVNALLFSIERTFADYEMDEKHSHTISLLSLKEGLEGV